MRHRNVLIAEDEETAFRLLRTTLVHWGYEVQGHRNGVDALRALERPDSPSIALLDWMMPGLEGIDVCRELRKTPEGATKYLILLTTRGAKDDLVEGLRAGADDYVVKPFHLGELRARLLVGTRIVALQQDLSEKVAELTAALDTVRILESDFGARPQPPRSDERAPVTLPDPRARGANDAVNSR